MKRSPGLWGHLLISSNQFYLKKMNHVKPLVDAPRDQTTFSLYKITMNFFTPPKWLEGHLCPGINILGNMYLQYWPTGWHLRLKTFNFWMTFDMIFFYKVNRVRWGYYCVLRKKLPSLGESFFVLQPPASLVTIVTNRFQPPLMDLWTSPWGV